MELTVEIVVLLFFVTLFAGTIDAIAGGGGLITIPVLLSLGMPPATALATNKLQASAGAFTSALYFVRQGLIDLKEMRLSIFMAFVGAVFGGWLLLRVDASALSIAIPVFLILIALYFLFSPNIGTVDRAQRMSLTVFAITAVFFLGFYDGVFGPGTGSFFAVAFVSLLGYNLTKATAHSKLLNFVSNFAALLYFIAFGEVAWLVGGVMIVGQVLGAQIGSRLVLNNGQKLIRPVIVIVCLAMSARLIWDAL